MCDYSLHGIKNRLAIEREDLVVHRFLTGSKGLTSPEYLKPVRARNGFLAYLLSTLVEPSDECAVCIPDGATLLMTGIGAKLQLTYGISANELVIFRQLTLDEASHRDAVEFSNGERVRLQDLDEGQHFMIHTLSASAVSDAESIYDFRST